jgi:hypothetical protein
MEDQMRHFIGNSATVRFRLKRDLVVLIFMAVCTGIVCAGCVKQTGPDPDSETSVVSASDTTYSVSVHFDAIRYGSESEMIERIRSGAAINEFSSQDTPDHYFRLKMPPEGYILAEIRVKALVMEFDYVSANAEADRSKNLITFFWDREPDRGGVFSNMPWVTMEENEAYSFEIIEDYSLDENGFLDENREKTEVYKLIRWTQGEESFAAYAPLWFTEEDALTYCVAEKVMIE